MAHVAVNQKESDDRSETREHCAGYWVHDPLGRKVGKVEQLFVNGRSEPEYISLSLGLFGLKKVLIPVQSVTVDHTGRALVLQ